MADVGVILTHFGSSDEVREFELGRFELVRIGGTTVGRATYQPGWRWSLHVGPSLGLTRCPVEHVGLVLSGAATAAFDDGSVVELRAGQLFHIPGTPHDSWVLGDEPYVSLHFLGAERYATESATDGEGTEVARRLYEAFAERDGAALRSVLHPSFVGAVSAGMPLGVGGRHDGPEAMLSEVWAPVFAAYDVVPTPDELLPAGPDRVVAIGTYRGTERATGTPVNAAFVHVLRIDDGRVRELAQVTDTASWPTCSAPEKKEQRPRG